MRLFRVAMLPFDLLARFLYRVDRKVNPRPVPTPEAVARLAAEYREAQECTRREMKGWPNGGNRTPLAD